MKFKKCLSIAVKIFEKVMLVWMVVDLVRELSLGLFKKRYTPTYKEQFLAGYNLAKKLTASDFSDEIDDAIDPDEPYKVIENSNALWVSQFRLAGVFMNTNRDTCIVVDKYFNELPKRMKTFILTHEKGHIVNKEKFTIDSFSYLKTFFIRQFSHKIEANEKIADDYAISELGAEYVYNCLVWMYHNLIGGKRDIRARIKNAKSQIK